MRHDETWWDMMRHDETTMTTELTELLGLCESPPLYRGFHPPWSEMVRTGIEWPRMAMNSHEFTISTKSERDQNVQKRSKHVIHRDTIWYLFSDSCKVISGDICWSSNTFLLWPKCDLLRSMGSPELPQNVTSIKNSAIRTVSPEGRSPLRHVATLRQWLLDKTLNSAASFWIPGKIWKDLERSGKIWKDLERSG